MAFTNYPDAGRLSFGIVTSLPDDVIDSFLVYHRPLLKKCPLNLEEELEFQFAQ